MPRSRTPFPHAPASERSDFDKNPRTDPALDFVDKPLSQMTPGDYDAIGFMSGLEVHQQLATRSKLFCRCPSGGRSTRVDAEVLRHMRPTLSELGEYDGTALMEFKTRKEIIYLLQRASVCTYEIDDTPPFPMDEEAIRIAIEVSRLCNLSLVSELHVMRKQYLDGSIPTGFQRTTMVGLGGEVPFDDSELGPGRKIRIRQLSLEEDSCREVTDEGHQIVFRTDRLGVPLTETVTEPDLLTPLDVRTGGQLVARIAQATGKVLRGPGAARQDVNVSVAGGRRVEIKGVSSHRAIPRLVHVEAFRQLNLLRVQAELLRRGIRKDDLRSDDLIDEVYPTRDEPGVVGRRIRLPGFGALLDHDTQPGVTLAQEFADRLRVIACLTGSRFMEHAEDGDDALVVVCGQEDDVDLAAAEVLERAREALDGVPAETRQAFHDGTNGFERILPGADRMYPDTDTPPIPIPDVWVRAVEDRLPERPWERERRYVAAGVAVDAARRMVGTPRAALFEEVAPESPEAAALLANSLERRRRELPTVRRCKQVIAEVEAGRLHPCAFGAALDGVATAGDIAGGVAAAKAALAELNSADPDARIRWAMGKAMPLACGADPNAVADLLREVVAP